MITILTLFDKLKVFNTLPGATHYQVFHTPVTWNAANDNCDLAAPPFHGSTVNIDSSIMAQGDELWVRQTWNKTLEGTIFFLFLLFFVGILPSQYMSMFTVVFPNRKLLAYVSAIH